MDENVSSLQFNVLMSRRAPSAFSAFVEIKRHWIFDSLRGQGLKALALKGSIWTLIGFGGQKVLQLCSNLLLTRLLFPEAFGLISLVSIVLVGLGMFSDIGIGASIIQDKRGEDAAYLNTAWTIQIIRGFTIWIVACLIAWPASLLYGESAVFPLLCVVGLTAAIGGFQTTALAVANRKIRLARLTFIQLVGQMISIAVTVILAWILRSVWALAIGSVIGTVVQTVLGHIVLKSHGHAIRMERESLHSLVRFGRWIFLATLITFLGGNGMQLVQAKLVSIDTLGKLYVAGTIGSALGDLTNRIATAVGFPALASIARGQPQRMRSVLDRIRIRMFIAVLPGFIALSLVSGPLIHALYDARYVAASNYLAIIAITSAMSVILVEYQNAFIASGNTHIHFIVMSIFMVLRLVGIISGFYVGGVEGMLVGSGVATLTTYFVTAYYAQKVGWLSPATDSVAIIFIFVGACVSYFVHGGAL